MRDYSGVQVEESPDATIYTFSASWLKSFTSCPEQARLEMVGELPRYEYDYFSTGTATHAGIEHTLSDWKEYGSPLPLNDALYIAQETFSDLMLLDSFVWAKYKEPEARALINATVNTWYREVLPKLGEPLGVEHKFEVELDSRPAREDECVQKRVRLRGTIDSIESEYLNDWKTSGKPWRDELWQLKRWDLQSMVYVYAWGAERPFEIVPSTFRWFVMLADSSLQIVEAQRTHEHFEWLRQRCWGIVELIDAELSCWPMLDDSWKCSPKWCSAFSACKGAHWNGEAPW